MDSRDKLTSYESWERSVPEAMTGDSLWKVEAYRLALFACEIGWRDVTKLLGDRRTFGLSDQLYRALGSISANWAEGYSRGTGRYRARFTNHASRITLHESRFTNHASRITLYSSRFTNHAILITFHASRFTDKEPAP